jgi:CIC family chloride channel protein
MRQVLAVVEQLRAREEQLFLILTVVVGVLAGLAAVLFSLSIDAVTRMLFGLDPGHARLVLIPVIGSLIGGILLARVLPGVRGSGVPQTKTAYHLASGNIPAHVPIGKFITGVLCIGTGQSMGREGPSVQIGAGLASMIGRWFQLSPRRIRDLVPVGAAGALAAAFNTPVAAVLFALEEIIGDNNAPLLGSTVVASVSSVIVERSILGNEPLFHVPPYHLEHPAELIAYAVLGVMGAVISLVFCKLLLWLRAGFLALPARTRIIQPVAGGVTVAGLLLITPAVMGVGYDYVDQALNGNLLFGTMVLLCLLKLLATTISYAAGNAGGIFAPSLYIGAMAGGALGMLVQQYAPIATAGPGAYALVGMGTLFAGIIRAPMTSVLMIFEITQDYQILVPLMVANLLSFLIARRYQPIAVYEALLRQDNIHLSHNAPARGRKTRRAQEVMVAADLRLDDVPAVHVHPDHDLPIVLERLAETDGELPVVLREDSRVVRGMITIESIHLALQGHSRR